VAPDRWTAYSVAVWAICVGWIATSHSIAAARPLLVLSFFLLVPMFLFVARETTRKESHRFRRPKDLIAPFQPTLTGRRRSV
jgi:hypothetical protein